MMVRYRTLRGCAWHCGLFCPTSPWRWRPALPRWTAQNPHPPSRPPAPPPSRPYHRRPAAESPAVRGSHPHSLCEKKARFTQYFLFSSAGENGVHKSGDVDPDPHGSVLSWVSWIRIRIEIADPYLYPGARKWLLCLRRNGMLLLFQN
jgi:hypothetical protein